MDQSSIIRINRPAFASSHNPPNPRSRPQRTARSLYPVIPTTARSLYPVIPAGNNMKPSSRPEAAYFAAATGVPDERTCSLGWSVEGPLHFAFACSCSSLLFVLAWCPIHRGLFAMGGVFAVILSVAPTRCHSERSEESPHWPLPVLFVCHSAAQRRNLLLLCRCLFLPSF
jgi:hypothetical protein